VCAYADAKRRRQEGAQKTHLVRLHDHDPPRLGHHVAMTRIQHGHDACKLVRLWISLGRLGPGPIRVDRIIQRDLKHQRLRASSCLHHRLTGCVRIVSSTKTSTSSSVFQSLVRYWLISGVSDTPSSRSWACSDGWDVRGREAGRKHSSTHDKGPHLDPVGTERLDGKAKVEIVFLGRGVLVDPSGCPSGGLVVVDE
jgi:hypothetical protein